MYESSAALTVKLPNKREHRQLVPEILWLLHCKSASVQLVVCTSELPNRRFLLLRQNVHTVTSFGLLQKMRPVPFINKSAVRRRVKQHKQIICRLAQATERERLIFNITLPIPICWPAHKRPTNMWLSKGEKASTPPFFVNHHQWQKKTEWKSTQSCSAITSKKVFCVYVL